MLWGRGSPWVHAAWQRDAEGEAAGLGAPDLCQHPPAQCPESTNTVPSRLRVAEKFKISGSATQGCEWHFQKPVVIYIAP